MNAANGKCADQDKNLLKLFKPAGRGERWDWTERRDRKPKIDSRPATIGGHSAAQTCFQHNRGPCADNKCTYLDLKYVFETDWTRCDHSTRCVNANHETCKMEYFGSSESTVRSAMCQCRFVSMLFILNRYQKRSLEHGTKQLARKWWYPRFRTTHCQKSHPLLVREHYRCNYVNDSTTTAASGLRSETGDNGR
jgi:hypothetical protein